MQAATKVGLGKVEDQSRKAHAETERSEAGTGKTEVEVARVKKAMKPYHSKTIKVSQNKLAPMNNSLPFT